MFSAIVQKVLVDQNKREWLEKASKLTSFQKERIKESGLSLKKYTAIVWDNKIPLLTDLICLSDIYGLKVSTLVDEL